MTTLQKLAHINMVKRIYNICYRNAGVGFQFYEPPPELKDQECFEYRRYLVVHAYYPTFKAALDAEFKRCQ